MEHKHVGRRVGGLAALVLTGALLAPATASAHVSVGIGINLGPPLIYGPPVVAYAPPPVVYYEPAPPPVYYGPPVVYGPTVIYRRPYHWPRCWWQDGYRVCR